jgi:ketosteroid isomerase-like protein
MRPVAVALLVLGSALGPGALAAQDHPSVSLPPALDRVLRDYEQGWRKGDATGVAQLFTTDGFALPNRKPPARGHQAIAAAYQGQAGGLKLRALAWATSDSVGYIVGAYTYDNVSENRDIGKFVLALRKNAQGKWLIAADIDNSVR